MLIYEASAEDLTHLGSSMGTEYTTTESLGVFSTAKKAQGACEKHYGKPLKWKREKHGWRTDDLGHVMYDIREREVS